MYRSLCIDQKIDQNSIPRLNFQQNARKTTQRSPRSRMKHSKCLTSYFDQFGDTFETSNLRTVLTDRCPNQRNSNSVLMQQIEGSKSDRYNMDGQIAWIIARLDRHERDIIKLKQAKLETDAPPPKLTAYLQSMLKQSQLIQFKINDNFQKTITNLKLNLADLKQELKTSLPAKNISPPSLNILESFDLQISAVSKQLTSIQSVLSQFSSKFNLTDHKIQHLRIQFTNLINESNKFAQKSVSQPDTKLLKQQQTVSIIETITKYMLDSNGYLLDQEGHYLTDQTNQPIFIPKHYFYDLKKKSNSLKPQLQ